MQEYTYKKVSITLTAGGWYTALVPYYGYIKSDTLIGLKSLINTALKPIHTTQDGKYLVVADSGYYLKCSSLEEARKALDREMQQKQPSFKYSTAAIDVKLPYNNNL